MTFKAKLYKYMYPVAKIYWFITRPKTSGAGCIIEHGDKILLIRNTYGDGSWSFPGGGVKKNEEPEQAAVREVKEEVGIMINNPTSLGSFLYPWQYRLDTVNVFMVNVDSENIKINKDEIKEAKWFAKNSISNIELSAVGRRMFELYQDWKRGWVPLDS